MHGAGLGCIGMCETYVGSVCSKRHRVRSQATLRVSLILSLLRLWLCSQCVLLVCTNGGEGVAIVAFILQLQPHTSDLRERSWQGEHWDWDWQCGSMLTTYIYV